MINETVLYSWTQQTVIDKDCGERESGGPAGECDMCHGQYFRQGLLISKTDALNGLEIAPDEFNDLVQTSIA